MNEEGKKVTVEFLMNYLAVEDGNTQHKFLSQINSNSSMNMIAYNRRQNRGKSNRAKHNSGKNDFFIYCPTVQKTPRYGRKVHEVWQTRASTRPELRGQECQV